MKVRESDIGTARHISYLPTLPSGCGSIVMFNGFLPLPCLLSGMCQPSSFKPANITSDVCESTQIRSEVN